MSIELPSDSSFWVAAGTIALAITTGMLALITYLYMRETKRMRIETEKMRIAAQLPSFAIEPTSFRYSTGERTPDEFGHLNLTNHGQTASDITAQCSWLESADSGGSGRTFYIASLAKHGYALLDIPGDEISTKKLLLIVKIRCKDASGNDYAITLSYGLDKIRNTSIRLTRQGNYYSDIADALGDVVSKLRKS